jgi:hypothetical protein
VGERYFGKALEKPMPFWMKDGLSRFFWYTVLDGKIGE